MGFEVGEWIFEVGEKRVVVHNKVWKNHVYEFPADSFGWIKISKDHPAAGIGMLDESRRAIYSELSIEGKEMLEQATVKRCEACGQVIPKKCEHGC